MRPTDELARESAMLGLADGAAVPWWREWQFWALAAMTIAVYFSRMSDLPIRGEETRRAMVAREILESGDWIVARQQGVPFLSRPPAGSWPIAWLSAFTGELSLVEIRLPTLLSTLLTTLLIYVYSRRFLSEVGALSSGVAFATFVQVLQLGRLAETEAIFTFFLSAGLMLWHWGYVCRWPTAATWMIAYGMVAIATLTKSLQAPTYFCGTIVFYLLWNRDWRSLVSRNHLFGLLTFAAIFAAWQVPFYLALDWQSVRKVWASDVGLRLEQLSTGAVIGHLATYPLQVWACLLPWSLLLPAYAWPQFRRTLGGARPMVTFAVFCWLVALPTCWFVPNARPRYLMPLFPLAAPLVGLVVQRVHEADAPTIVRRGWNWFIGGSIAAILSAAAVVAAAGWLQVDPIDQIAQPAWFAAWYATSAIVAALLLLRSWNRWSGRAATICTLVIAAFLGLTVSGAAVNSLVALDPQAERQIAELRRRIPADEPLGSFGLVETLFSYHWRRPIDYVRRELPLTARQLPPRFQYFCYSGNKADRVELPFPWRVEGVINCDRTTESNEGKVVVVGRRLATVALLPKRQEERR
ncbi:MAG: glycosyltransferase family 39 protein [Pirellulales bacterium]|nr:glycosyltransferase family 39 protein [Pirellulales bacterium]